MSGEQYKPVVGFLLTLNLLARPFAGPPDMPKDRAKALQDAFGKAWADGDLLKIAEKSDSPVEYTDGDEALGLVQDILRLPPKVITLIREAYGIK